MSYQDFLSLTPLEVSILFNNMIKDNEEQKKRMEQSSKGGNSVGAPISADKLL